MGEIGRDIDVLGVPVHTIGMRSGVSGLQKIRKLILLLNDLKPDIIQGWMYHGNLLATFASFFIHQRVPVLWNVRGPGIYLSRRFKKMSIYWLTSRFSRFPLKIINNSKASAEIHERMLNYPSDRWVIIPNGFDPDVFKPNSASRDKLRFSLDIAPTATLIGHVARYDPMKDHPIFLTAAARLVMGGANVHFVMIGPDVDQNNGELVQMISDLGLRERVHLFGARRDLPFLIPGFDIGCLSSYGEGFPNVIGEMMSSGVPCVVTDVGDCAELVGDTGKIVPSRDHVSLAAALKEMVDLGMEARRNLGIEARQRVIQKFSLKTVVKQYEQLYLQISEEYREH
jgi:glycosyltransferase involved in cell wall biosynthesis